MWDHRSYWVAANRPNTVDTSTLTLRPEDDAIPDFMPGQFVMVTMAGATEMPVPISGDPTVDDGTLQLTVQGLLRNARPGSTANVRGPFGLSWDLDSAAGTDLLLVASGFGLATLRPALLHALRYRRRYRRIMLVADAKTRTELLYPNELAAIACNTDTEVIVTVDKADSQWHGRIGFVTEPLAQLQLNPDHTTAMLCGPESIVRLSVHILLDRGFPADRIQVSACASTVSASCPPTPPAC